MTTTLQFEPTWRSTLRSAVLSLLGIVILGLAIYFLIVLNWSFSEGDRAGYLQKFSKKGWVCKTYEGEMAMTTVPGVAPVLWQFSVWDETVADQINRLLGKRVVVHYREYRGIPTSCFGETSYFVDRIEAVPD
jgi:hypothetical protein